MVDGFRTGWGARFVSRGTMFKNPMLVENDIVFKIRANGAEHHLLCCADDGSLRPVIARIASEVSFKTTLTLAAELISHGGNSGDAAGGVLQNVDVHIERASPTKPVISIYLAVSGAVDIRDNRLLHDRLPDDGGASLAGEVIVLDTRLNGGARILRERDGPLLPYRSGTAEATITLTPGACVVVLHIMHSDSRRVFVADARGDIEGWYDPAIRARVDGSRAPAPGSTHAPASTAPHEFALAAGAQPHAGTATAGKTAQQRGLFARRDLPPNFHFPYIAISRRLRCAVHPTQAYCVTASIPPEDDGESDHMVKAEGRRLVADGHPDIVTEITGDEVWSFAARINEPALGSSGYNAMMVDHPCITRRDYYDGLGSQTCIIPSVVFLPFGARADDEIFMWYGPGFKRPYKDFAKYSTDLAALANIATFNTLLKCNTFVNALQNQGPGTPPWYRSREVASKYGAM
ncbi:hypothetical protein JKP88DRAFT_317339 [Tribonema minus]|uniref:Uncharacterized protein n=1 Tax=Tribonema minus TaxID=303371 RepID=A0A835Z0P3_9STRA|nr:hypothetical protein JKP88DRAFT_317339 [Tribonema minus]